MRLARMGAFFPTRLSFMRTLTRRLGQERATVTRSLWEIDEHGFGRAVYTVPYGGHTYSLVAFATPLEAERRTDRVIAEAWDSSYVLFDGVPDAADLDRLQANAPLQEAGRFEACDLVLCRANKSLRLFEHVIDRLSQGQQPEPALVGSIGYLMRTTAVYGNGKFGLADRACIAGRSGLAGPFQAEMLTVWLIRGFTHDLVEHVARNRNPSSFVPLDRDLKRHLGVGNATGLGMAPFLLSHPVLLNNWMLARETALARVRAVSHCDAETIESVRKLIARARRHLEQWNVDDVRQADRIHRLRQEMAEVDELVTPEWLSADKPWDRLLSTADQWSVECQELLVALVLEPHGALVDDLADHMAATSAAQLQPATTVTELRAGLAEHYDWALRVDFAKPDASHLFWYVSQEKLEPRLGIRFEEAGADLEMPLDIARQVQALDVDLAGSLANQSVAEFLLKHPKHRHIVRRVQTAVHCPYAEIRDNLIGAGCLPIDILRCKLAFFGASKFNPKSDRWTRITLCQGAPLFDELSTGAADDWWLPVLET
jgi:hypothetical protein